MSSDLYKDTNSFPLSCPLSVNYLHVSLSQFNSLQMCLTGMTVIMTFDVSLIVDILSVCRSRFSFYDILMSFMTCCKALLLYNKQCYINKP